MSNDLTSGQDYAVKFLKSLGLKLVSTNKDLKRGDLIFDDPFGCLWGIYKRGGIVRKQSYSYNLAQWGYNTILHRESRNSPIDDDQYMDLAEILSNHFINHKQEVHKRKQELDKYEGKVSMFNHLKAKGGVKYESVKVPYEKIVKALDVLTNKGFNLNLHIGYFIVPGGKILVSGDKANNSRMRIIFSNENPHIGYTKVTKQYSPDRFSNEWSEEKIINL